MAIHEVVPGTFVSTTLLITASFPVSHEMSPSNDLTIPLSVSPSFDLLDLFSVLPTSFQRPWLCGIKFLRGSQQISGREIQKR
jgi:hypothetical protein